MLYFWWKDIANKWREVKDLVPKRDQVLQNEMIRQENNERLRRQFAQKANLVGQWIERHLDAVASVGVQRGSLEDQLAKLHVMEKDVMSYRPNIDELERYNQEVQEHMIFENRHTQYTMEVCDSLKLVPPIMFGIMTEELVICEIRINEDDSNSRMMSFEVIMPLKLQSIMKFVKINDMFRRRKNGRLEFYVNKL